ncbi:MarR family winged helix-turn-helix transcriptional regulator [Litorihabitans aurantiacus]|uniref:HTH marR-type domain-containing protein n=1 Tax=Litorihabitans aurantiacus TaxID=1930061 RepID=A0AA37UGZ3_9MICO|nr:MarR family transcriptional regulator [Litorihabitans aurantiacus]GMA30249.1 hypothetical protein GCM10025875_02410 [Litorihabitans aurantiacus]
MTEDIERSWDPATGDDADPVDILALLRRYREADRQLRTRTRASMGMGETDLLALRYLLRAKQRGAVVRQKELAAALGITGASASTLVDRLVRDGYVRRVAHPNDRRSVAVETTQHSDDEVRATLDGLHRRLLAAVETMPRDELDAVAAFLHRISTVVEANLADDAAPAAAPVTVGSGGVARS